MKKFIFVLKNRECGAVYVSSNLYDMEGIQHFMVHLDSIGVDVLDVIPVDIDLSKYEHQKRID